MRQRLLGACAFDWSKISPAIFGSLFQSVMDKEARRHLGATTRPRKTFWNDQTSFLDDLQKELDACGKNNKNLFEFQESCPSWNFWSSLWMRKLFWWSHIGNCVNWNSKCLSAVLPHSQLGLYDLKSYIHVRPEQFFGIEIEEFLRASPKPLCGSWIIRWTKKLVWYLLKISRSAAWQRCLYLFGNSLQIDGKKSCRKMNYHTFLVIRRSSVQRWWAWSSAMTYCCLW